MKNILLFVITLCIASFKTADSMLSPNGANVCSKEEKYTVTYNKYYEGYILPRNITLCFAFPSRCAGFRWIKYTGFRPMYDTKTQTIYYCCPGYRQVENKCVPRKCSSGKLNEILLVLGPVLVAFTLTSIILGVILYRCKKKIQSTDPIYPVQRRVVPSSACRFKALHPNKKHRAVDNIYQANIDSKSPFPLLEPLHGNNKYSSDLHSSERFLMAPQTDEQYGDVEEIYQELPIRKPPFTLLKPTYESREDSSEAGQPRVHDRLDVQQNEREANPGYPFDELKICK